MTKSNKVFGSLGQLFGTFHDRKLVERAIAAIILKDTNSGQHFFVFFSEEANVNLLKNFISYFIDTTLVSIDDDIIVRPGELVAGLSEGKPLYSRDEFYIYRLIDFLESNFDLDDAFLVMRQFSKTSSLDFDIDFLAPETAEDRGQVPAVHFKSGRNLSHYLSDAGLHINTELLQQYIIFVLQQIDADRNKNKEVSHFKAESANRAISFLSDRIIQYSALNKDGRLVIFDDFFKEDKFSKEKLLEFFYASFSFDHIMHLLYTLERKFSTKEIKSLIVEIDKSKRSSPRKRKALPNPDIPADREENRKDALFSVRMDADFKLAVEAEIKRRGLTKKQAVQEALGVWLREPD